MPKKKKTRAAAPAAAAVSKLSASDLPPDDTIEQLKSLNSILLKETAELREHVNQLRTELDSLTADRGKLEEEGKMREEMLQSVMHEKVLLESCLKEKKDLVEKLVREMEGVNSRNEADMEIFNAETKAKFSALEEQCRNLNEIRSQQENELSDFKVFFDEQKVELIARYEEMKQRNESVEGDFKRTLIEFEVLKKDKLELEMTFDVKEEKMNMEINELKGNLTKMVAEKDLIDQSRAKDEIEISNLHRLAFDLDSARQRLEDACRSCSEENAIKEAECAVLQRELKLKEEEAVALRLQVKELTESKQNLELEKASLEKHLEASWHGLHDIEKKLKTFRVGLWPSPDTFEEDDC